jgi:Tfp pilus assembly protein PilF
LAIRPTHPRALTNRGNVFLEDGQLDEATARYQTALNDNPEYAPARHNLGVTLRRQGKFAASIRELRRAQRHTVKQAREAQRLRPRRSASRSGAREQKRRNRLPLIIGAANTHGAAHPTPPSALRYSTVTLLARLRG